MWTDGTQLHLGKVDRVLPTLSICDPVLLSNKLLYFSKLGLDPSIACGSFMISPIYYGLCNKWFKFAFQLYLGKVVWLLLTLLTWDPLLPSNIAPFVKTISWPKCCLWVFCDCPKLFWALQVIFFCFLIAFGTRFHLVYKLYPQDILFTHPIKI
jgi:hypothetical protein